MRVSVKCTKGHFQYLCFMFCKIQLCILYLTSLPLSLNLQDRSAPEKSGKALQRKMGPTAGGCRGDQSRVRDMFPLANVDFL